MEKIPTENVNVWIYNDLDPKSLIPAIMKYNQGKNPTTSQVDFFLFFSFFFF